MDFGEKQDPAGGEIFGETIKSRPPQAENFWGVFKAKTLKNDENRTEFEPNLRKQ